MRIFFLASLLTLAYSEVGAYSQTGSTDISEGVPAAKVNTIEQGSNIIVKLDCPGCPYVIRHGYPRHDDELEFPSRSNSLVRLRDAIDFDSVGWFMGIMANGVSAYRCSISQHL